MKLSLLQLPPSVLEKLKEALASTPITTPRIPVVSNVDAEPHSDPDTIKDIEIERVMQERLGAAAPAASGPEAETLRRFRTFASISSG